MSINALDNQIIIMDFMLRVNVFHGIDSIMGAAACWLIEIASWQFGRFIPPNYRIDRRLAVNQREDKRCVLVMRQGTEKTKTFVLESEN